MSADWLTVMASAALFGGTSVPEKPCLTRAEALGLVVTILPDAVTSAQTRCRSSLPATSALIQAGGVIAARWRAESAGFAIDADRAIDKVSRLPLASALGSETARKAIKPAILRETSKRLASHDCANASEILDAISPLPVHNVARALLALGESQPKTDGLPFSFCKAV